MPIKAFPCYTYSNQKQSPQTFKLKHQQQTFCVDAAIESATLALRHTFILTHIKFSYFSSQTLLPKNKKCDVVYPKIIK